MIHQQMEYIYTIYEFGSIRQAADHLCITQPALSIALRKAEEELGEQIFDRGKHPLEPTPAGRIYINGIKQIHQIEDNIKAEIADLAEMNTGSVTIGGTQYFISYILPDILKEHMRLYPKIQLSIVEANSDQILKKLLNNQIDLLISAKHFHSDKFIVFPIFQEMILIAVSRSLITDPGLLAWGITRQDIISGRYVDMADLDELRLLKPLPFIVMEKGSNLHEISMGFFTAAGIEPNICMKVEHLATAHYFSLHGLGATFTTKKLIENSADSDTLYFKIGRAPMIRNFNIIVPRKHYLSKATRKFMTLCESCLS